MKKIFILSLLISLHAFSQTTIFTETFGTPSSTTAISAFEAANGFDNDSLTMTGGDAANPADVRSTSASSGYTGASGNGNIYFTTAAGANVPTDERGFAIEGINAAKYANMKLNFAVRKEGGAGTAFAALAVQFWDGAAYQNVTVNGYPVSSNAVGWYYISNVLLPQASQINGLKIRFLRTGAIACRLDDVSLVSDSTGGEDDTTTVPPTNITTSALSLGFGQINTVPSSSQNFTVTGTNLTDNIVVTPPSNYELSLNNTLWNTSAVTLPQSGGTVSATTMYVRYNPSAVGSHSGNIVFTSTGVPSQSVAVNGTYTTIVPPSSDYYSGAYRLYGPALRTALHNIIKGHSVISYDGLYTYFPSTDSKPNGKVWDIYSDVPGGTPAYEYIHGSKKCGSYSGEGDCYNREHSWCDSWLGATNPARSDLFHMYPTDGYVNNRRSNYPYGTVGSASYTSGNGSKVGTCSFPGYSGTVFEPINEYKGDVARSAMYMSVRYYTEDGSWIATPGTNKSDLVTWYANLLYDWSIRDTVSTKEINRNAAIFTIQKNRNPFIDHPEFAAEIWQTALAPSVVTVTNPTATSLIVDFSRYVDSAVSVTKGNFIINNSIGSPTSISWGVNNDISKLSMTIPAVSSGTTYTMQILNLKSINNVVMKDTVVTFKTSGVAGIDKTLPQNPYTFTLKQNFPNPFNPSTTIEFTVPASGYATLKIFTMLGQEVATLFEGEAEGGKLNQAHFDGKELSSGIYLARLSSDGRSEMKKLVLMK